MTRWAGDRRLGRWLVTGVLAAALVVGGAACSDDGDETTTGGTSASAGTGAPGPDGTDVVVSSFDVYLLDEASEACDEVVAAPRQASGAVDLDEVLAELLAGPTEQERSEGLGGWFGEDTAGLAVSVEVEDGTAAVDLDPALPDVIPNASSSCGSAGLLAQLDATTTQRPEVDRAVYSLGGDVDAFYLWLQLAPPES